MLPYGTKCDYHRGKMDSMIFKLNAGVYATSLYILICSQVDEGQRPTLNGILPSWTASADDLVLAVKELSELRVLQPIGQLDYDKELYVNRRERWSWCRWKGWT
jgi:hypothetical protein